MRMKVNDVLSKPAKKYHGIILILPNFIGFKFPIITTIKIQGFAKEYPSLEQSWSVSK